MHEPAPALHDRELTEFEFRLLKWHLVIVDALGYGPLCQIEVKLLFQFFFLGDVYGSFIVTDSQHPARG